MKSIASISILLLTVLIPSVSAEIPNPGAVLLESSTGEVSLSWRALSDVGRYTVMRYDPDQLKHESGFGMKFPEPLSKTTVTGTSFLDPNVPQGKSVLYGVTTEGGTIPLFTAMIQTGAPKPYLSIPLQGDYDFQKIGIGDLDGDGEFEYIIKQPNFNTDPYQQPGYWKKSETTYKLEAYKRNGTLLWRYDMGWAIEAGIWYSPWLVYDLDGDGKAEVYCKAGEGDPRDEKGLVTSGPEYLVKIDGESGQVVAKTAWISREGYPDYNYYCRNFLAIAYLDGQSPSLLMQRGTYNVIKTKALDKNLNEQWHWEVLQRHPEKSKNYYGQGSHGLLAADIDQDGKDELVIGGAVLDHDGTPLWTLGMGHPDICYVADIDPSRPGLEIFYGFESRQETDGMCVVDAKTGEKLWALKEKTAHLHGQGLCADILAEYPGMEVFSGERDFEKRWLFSAAGQLISFLEKGNLSPRPLWWDADPQKEISDGAAIKNWGEEPLLRVEGRPILVVDCLGDWREELITTVKGEIRIYSSPIPSPHAFPPLMQDRQYRLGIVNQTMGYYYPAHLGLDSQTRFNQKIVEIKN